MAFPTNGGHADELASCWRKESIMPRRKFSREFKISAVKLVNEQGYSIVEAAKSLGIDQGNVRQWVEKFGSQADQAPSTEASLRAELRRLRKQNAELLMERDILKKAAAYFARERS
jgi:transposase